MKRNFQKWEPGASENRTLGMVSSSSPELHGGFVSESSVIARGAEAVLKKSKWNERDVVIKERVVKSYRLAEIDKKLREERIRKEVKLMREARRVGISVPIIYDVDIKRNRIVMEYVKGEQAKTLLNSLRDRKIKKWLCNEIGKCAGRLHKNSIVHGDLTTSNIIVSGDRLYFIDFSLGEKSSELESRGVDFHLLKEAFKSAHSDSMNMFVHVEKGYSRECPDWKEVLEKAVEIERRGRYEER